MSIRESFKQVALDWDEYRANTRVDHHHPVYELVTETIPGELAEVVHDQKHFVAEGSTGKGNITAAPWFAAFDTRVTTSARQGYYVVYLFSIDMSWLYLCFGLGTTQFNNAYPKKTEAYAAMESAKSRLTDVVARHLPESLSNRVEEGFVNLLADRKNRLHKEYENACVYHIRYEVDDLPSNDQLETDLEAFVRFLGAVVEDPVTPDTLSILQSTSTALPTPIIEVDDFQPRPPKGSKKGGTGGSGRGYSRRSKIVGDRGEAVVMQAEQRRLRDGGRPDLAKQIVHEEAIGNHPGWDISSFELDGNPIRIEVKATDSKSMTAVELTENEWSAATRDGEQHLYYIYLVTDAFSPAAKVESLHNPAARVADDKLAMRPIRFLLNLRSV